jgi:serine/threonine protein kinase
VQKRDTLAMFAMKQLSKQDLVHQDNVSLYLSERRILAKVNSPFVVRLKYACQDANSLMLLLDLCAGGDLKFHLHSCAPRGFNEQRARFYAAEVLWLAILNVMLIWFHRFFWDWSIFASWATRIEM